MTKIYIPLPSKEALDLYLEQDFDGFIIGIKNYSSKFNYYADISKLDKIIDKLKNENIKLYVSLNRLYYNNEIDNVRKIINKIAKLDIDGIIFTDIGVLNILNEIKYDKEIIWDSNHLGTNSKTINFLEKRGVTASTLSTEITYKEIIDIKKDTNIKIGAFLYGYINIATSSRKLLTNYFKYINKKKMSDRYIFKDKISKDTYNIVEEFNTDFFTGKILNGIKYFPKLIINNIDYIILDDFMLSNNNFYNVIEAFSSLRRAYDDKEFVSKLNEVVNTNTFGDTFTGFLDKKSVYKVDDYE